MFVVLNQNLRHLKANISVMFLLFNQILKLFLQVVFLIGFGYVYVDIVLQCGTVFITVAPEGKVGPSLIATNR